MKNGNRSEDATAPEHLLALGFSQVVKSRYPAGVPVHDVAGGCTELLVSYLAQLPPQQRAAMLSGIVDAVFAGLDANADADIQYLC